MAHHHSPFVQGIHNKSSHLDPVRIFYEVFCTQHPRLLTRKEHQLLCSPQLYFLCELILSCYFFLPNICPDLLLQAYLGFKLSWFENIYLHLPRMIHSISYVNLLLIHSSLETVRLRSTCPVYWLVKIYTG